MSLKHFHLLNKIGEGTESVVYRARRIADGNEYAIKIVRLLGLSEKEKINALSEVRFLASIRHSNVICFKEVFVEESSCSLCIVMEYANQGDLWQKIIEHQKKGNLFQESEIWNIFIQLVKGLKALHDLDIMHRDLKPSNVFLNSDGTCKIGDMNVSKLTKKGGFLTTQTGTPFYASPEVWKDQPYDLKSDIWSLGCVLYEMSTLKPPFKGDDMDTVFKKVNKGNYPRIPSHFSSDLNQVIKSLLQVNPNLRLPCDKILQFPPVLKYIDERHLTEMDEGVPFLLKTIRLPKHVQSLSESLPISNYLPLKENKLGKQRFINNLNGINFTTTEEEESDRDYATILLNCVGSKKGSSLPRIKRLKLGEYHKKRNNHLAPLYEEEIFSIKPINIINKAKMHHNTSKSNVDSTILHLEQSSTIQSTEGNLTKSSLKLLLPKIY